MAAYAILAAGRAFVGRAVFVGRVEERSRLEAAYEAARTRAQIVVVIGETGIGKSRLVAEFATQRRAAGAYVALGAAPPVVGQDLPFAPIIVALRELRDQLSTSEFEEVVPPNSDLSRFLPGSPSGADSGHGGELHLFEEVITLLAALGAQRDDPCVLVIEDLHWADRSTLALCAYLFRALRAPRAIVILTSRTADVTGPEPWSEILREGLRERHVHELNIAALADDDIRQIVSAAAPSALDLTTLNTATARAGGNPLFAEEIGQAEGVLPDSVATIVRRRLERVSASAQAFFRLAAVAAQRVDASVVDSGAQLLRLEPGSDVQELRRNGLLRVSSEGGLTLYRPTHPAFFEIAYLDLPPADRARLHWAIAEALGPRISPADAMGTIELGRHWSGAGGPAEGYRPLLHAAVAAEQLLAFPEAHQFFERALAARTRTHHSERTPIGFRPAQERDDDDWVLRAARCAALAGRPGRAVELLDRLGPAPRPDVGEARAQYLWEAGRTPEALQAYDDALAAAPDDARLRYRAARTFLLAGDRGRARVLADEAVRLAAASGDVASEAHAVRVLALLHAQIGDAAQATALLKRGHILDEQRAATSRVQPTPSRILDVLADYWSEASVRAHSGHAETDASSMSSGMRRVTEVAPASRLTAVMHGAAIDELAELGRWSEVDDLVEQLMARSRLPREVSITHARLLAVRGAWDEAASVLRNASAERASMPPAERASLAFAQGELSYWMGQPAESFAVAFEALATIGPRDLPLSELQLAAIALRAYADTARPGNAREHPLGDDARIDLEGRLSVLRIGAVSGRAGTLVELCDAELDRATAAAAAQDAEKWRRVAAGWRQLREPYGEAYSLFRAAEVLLSAKRERSGALDAARASHQIASELASEPLRLAIEALARRAHVNVFDQSPSKEAPTEDGQASAFGLSVRELEVVALLAEGRTNRQIAEALFISEKTAGHHVSSILGKLGASGRVEAAGIALRAGLTPMRSAPPVSDGDLNTAVPGQTVVLMFTDIVESTALIEAIGDATWAELAAWHERTLRALFERHGGREIDHAGDGFFVRFADIPAALDCAIEIQRRLADHRRAHGFAPRLRIAVHRATVVFDKAKVRGRGVHAAARLATAALSDEILVSANSMGPLNGRYLRGEPRELDLAGLAEPIAAVPIEWRPQPPTPGSAA